MTTKILYYTGDTIPIRFEVTDTLGVPLPIPTDAVVTFGIRQETTPNTAELIAGPWTCDPNQVSTEVGNADWSTGIVVGVIDGSTMQRDMTLGRHKLELQVAKNGNRTIIAEQSILIKQDSVT